ncbi:LVIVD repeat-containing protein [Mangrovimonas sp. YM274]|uniref:LVIVD repeat-containing protein n=1 Tax=Mangrovimonas sp. YM274 TaxID=3070660 RepID=UPI0027DDBF8F|nr:hypothetical protein [Mangrovimonas sp. YM274]WMI67637.1 hypothetical protein RBH95_10825 [Mangrovimonas sp. YM274]
MKTYISIVVALLLLTACSNDSNVSSQDSGYTESGQGGSLARFVVKGDYLYTVDLYGLHVFNITNISNPVEVNSVPIGFNIETLFAYKEYLYVGSRNGMYIYSVQNPELPEYLSDVQHFTACDPVVANDTHAFVTLHADIGCGNTINVLEVYDVSDIVNPVLISSRNLTQPIGLGLYGNYLFVCDDEVKIFDVSDPENSTLVNSINKNAFDVIIHQDLLILIGENGLYQYSLNYNDIQDITELSSLNI